MVGKTLSVALKTRSLGFYRTSSGPKWGFDRAFWGSTEPFSGFDRTLVGLLKGPKMEKIQDRPPGLNFQARLTISSEPPTKPYFLWGILEVKTENFNRDLKFQARLKFSTEIEVFQTLGPGTFLGRSLISGTVSKFLLLRRNLVQTPRMSVGHPKSCLGRS